MSPATLRRYRAERLLREQFGEVRARVIATVRSRLRASGIVLEESDLEVCYGQAWQGLYTAVLDGEQIANPTGWLVLVTFRRAIDERRARERVEAVGMPGDSRGADLGARGAVGAVEERDFAAELDDRMRLRHLFEGLRGRLSAHELQAATLCYLHGLSRAEAAAQMGVSEARMGKLMEGRGAGRPGVAGKVGALTATIRAGGWCEEQGSLMRALAYGILDPEGERYQLALGHRDECPACRAYVVSLRGLAAVLPPILPLGGLGASVLAGVGAHGATAVRGLGGGLSTPGAAGAGAAGAGSAAGGGWLLAGGSLSAKLAAGCVLALGVGAGCVALNGGAGSRRAPVHVAHSGHRARTTLVDTQRQAQTAAATARRGVEVPIHTTRTTALSTADRASREFGPERALGPSAPAPVSPSARASSASIASGSGEVSASSEFSGARSSSAPAPAPAGGGGSTSAAQREFSPG